jgi:hypothetical protein
MSIEKHTEHPSNEIAAQSTSTTSEVSATTDTNLPNGSLKATQESPTWLLLVLSENSIASSWVEKEAETAFERERSSERIVLYPIRLDDAVMEIDSGWPAFIRRTRHIGDFTQWKDYDHYQRSFDRLLRDLKVGEAKSNV